MSASCVACLDCDFSDALTEITKARALREIIGPSYRDVVIDANESHLQLCTGKLASALPTLRRLCSHGRAVVQIGALDGIANLFLALNRLEDCEGALQALVAPSHNYANFHNLRWVACIRLNLLLRKDQPAAAMSDSVSGLSLAEKASDTPLAIALLMIRAEALARTGRLPETAATLLDLSHRGALKYRDQRGSFYEACHHVLNAYGEATRARQFRERAFRVWRDEGKILPQLAVLSRHSGDLVARNYSQSMVDRLYASVFPDETSSVPIDDSAFILDAIASALDLAESPSLAATELMSVAAALGCKDHIAIAEGVNPSTT